MKPGPSTPTIPERANPESLPTVEERRGHGDTVFENAVAAKEHRHWRTLGRPHRSLLFGLGMFGLVGWSVTFPTLLGVALGAWIDRTWPSNHSWTLMLLVGGVLTGCLNAWHGVQRAGRTRED